MNPNSVLVVEMEGTATPRQVKKILWQSPLLKCGVVGPRIVADTGGYLTSFSRRRSDDNLEGGNAGGFLVEHSELVPWVLKRWLASVRGESSQLLFKAKWKAEGTDAELGCSCGLHTCKFWNGKRRERKWTLSLRRHMIPYKQLGISVSFYKLRELIKTTSEVSFGREYMTPGSKGIMSQGHHRTWDSTTAGSVKNLSKDISPEKVYEWMTNKHVKRHSAFVTKETQMKTTIPHHSNG